MIERGDIRIEVTDAEYDECFRIYIGDSIQFRCHARTLADLSGASNDALLKWIHEAGMQFLQAQGIDLP